MKTILDSSFRYRPSFDTDVRKTFERVRREQKAKQGEALQPGQEATFTLLQLDPSKKAGGN